jgi:glyoxylate/hydroxypyruvate reductase
MSSTIRIFTTGRLGKEFKAAVEAEFDHKEIQVDYHEKPDQLCIDKYKAIACFSPPEDLNLSHIDWIHTFGAGVNPIINHPSLNPRVILSRTVGLLGRKLAEYCLCYMLADFQNALDNFKQQQKKLWQQGTITDLFRTSAAVLGTGEMGREISALIAKLGCKVYGVNSSGRNYPEFVHCYKFEEFLEDPPHFETLISVLPSTRKTVGLLNNDFFRKISNIHFINVGRGDVVREKVLLELIAGGKIRKATLDVFPQEPLSEDSELWFNDKVVITPHQAALTDINNIMLSFRQAFSAINNKEKSDLFIDINKGY